MTATTEDSSEENGDDIIEQIQTWTSSAENTGGGCILIRTFPIDLRILVCKIKSNSSLFKKTGRTWRPEDSRLLASPSGTDFLFDKWVVKNSKDKGVIFG